MIAKALVKVAIHPQSIVAQSAVMNLLLLINMCADFAASGSWELWSSAAWMDVMVLRSIT